MVVADTVTRLNLETRWFVSGQKRKIMENNALMLLLLGFFCVRKP